MATPALAAAVSAAGGLGTLGHDAPERMRAALGSARRLTVAPLAANVLLPFARREHWEVAAAADVVVTFWGVPERPPGARTWWHQCGSVEEARAAVAAGADAVIAQGVEAGGHVRGTVPALELLTAVRAAVDVPVYLAGGIAERADVERALAAGAAGAVCGTRFVLSEESGAHPEYRRRLLEADSTVLTDLFGVGWAGAHRVVPNAATERWVRPGGGAPRWVREINRTAAPLHSRLPPRMHAATAARQRVGVPFFGPLPPQSAAAADVSPLYAGETVRRISDVLAAGAIVRALDPGQ